MLKIDFFAEIDCLGVKQSENHGVQFFRALDLILGLLMKTTPFYAFLTLLTITTLFYLIEQYVCLELYISDVVFKVC